MTTPLPRPPDAPAISRRRLPAPPGRLAGARSAALAARGVAPRAELADTVLPEPTRTASSGATITAGRVAPAASPAPAAPLPSRAAGPRHVDAGGERASRAMRAGTDAAHRRIDASLSRGRVGRTGRAASPACPRCWSASDVDWYRLGWYGGLGGRLLRTDRGVQLATAAPSDGRPRHRARGGALGARLCPRPPRPASRAACCWPCSATPPGSRSPTSRSCSGPIRPIQHARPSCSSVPPARGRPTTSGAAPTSTANYGGSRSLRPQNHRGGAGLLRPTVLPRRRSRLPAPLGAAVHPLDGAPWPGRRVHRGPGPRAEPGSRQRAPAGGDGRTPRVLVPADAGVRRGAVASGINVAFLTGERGVLAGAPRGRPGRAGHADHLLQEPHRGSDHGHASRRSPPAAGESRRSATPRPRSSAQMYGAIVVGASRTGSCRATATGFTRARACGTATRSPNLVGQEYDSYFPDLAQPGHRSCSPTPQSSPTSTTPHDPGAYPSPPDPQRHRVHRRVGRHASSPPGRSSGRGPSTPTATAPTTASRRPWTTASRG